MGGTRWPPVLFWCLLLPITLPRTHHKDVEFTPCSTEAHRVVGLKVSLSGLGLLTGRHSVLV